MDIVEIRENWENGDKYKVPYEESQAIRKNYKLLSPDFIIDEDKTVKWNREEVQRRNEESKLKIQNLRKEENRRFKLLQNDVTQYIVETYNFSLKKAQYIESRCYEHYHSEMYNYFWAIDDMANWVFEMPE